MAAVEAKAKVRKRHEKAIEAYTLWLMAHPRAKKERKLEMFDNFVDDPNYKPRKKQIEHLPRT